jgi:hypothetical protein
VSQSKSGEAVVNGIHDESVSGLVRMGVSLRPGSLEETAVADVKSLDGCRWRRFLLTGLAAVALFALLAWGAVRFHRPDASRQAEDTDSPLDFLDPRTWRIAPDDRKPHEESRELLDHVGEKPK